MQSIMDSKYDLSGKTNEQTLAAKQKFESFKLGAGLPSTPRATPGLPQHSHGRSHSRSHSRNTSITSITSMSNTSLSSSSSTNSTSDMSTCLSGPPKQRPNSHHRRRSSVSTRRESAELMGVSVPSLPASKPEDNINLGDKDSIRRRALWALEGKPDVSYSKVEIPELVSPQTENSSFNFPTRPSYPAGTGAGVGGGLNILAGKRDSIGKYMGSISSKDQLHTLVEEEEEEEDENVKGQAMDVFSDVVAVAEPTTPTPIPPTFTATKPSSTRPRPASLNLRPLALTSGSVINQTNGLPTPTLTPATKSTGLKSLSLTMSPCLATTNNSTNDMNSSMTGMRFQSLILSPELKPLVAPLRRRPSLNIICDSPSPLSLDGMKRQSSISYKSSLDNTVRNSAGLPTPIATPIISERKELFGSGSDELIHNQRPLSASEQHFLFKSHTALLARITDLENALSCRSRSRPVSTTSDISSNATSEPSDEMLSLIADLKAERDELKRDVDGWRMRVADLEDKVGIFTKRVEVERREAWVARSRLGLLEVEKSGLETSLEDMTLSFQEAVGKLDTVTLERDNFKADNEKLHGQVKRGQWIEEECVRLQAALEKERQLKEDLERTLDHADLLATPTPETSSFKRQMFRSMDSETSLTDVDPLEDTFNKGLTLKSVIEEEEDRHISDEEYDWEDNGLAGYEDEEDSDLNFQSPDGSSVGSDDDYPRVDLHVDTPGVPSLIASGTSSESASPTPTLPPAATKHAVHNSLSKTWTFPSGCLQAPPPRYEPEEVDRFFGCLDDLDTSPTMGFMAKAAHDKSLFSRSVHADIDSDDEMPPFVLPSHIGVEVEAPVTTLGVVLEEEEEEEEEVAEEEQIDEDFDGVEIDGGIRFTFNTPTTPTTPIISITPPFDIEPFLQRSPDEKPTTILATFDEDEAEVPFTVSKPKSQPSISSSSSVNLFDSDMSFSARNFSPSSIPRPKSLKSFTPCPPALTPPKEASTRFVPLSENSANTFGTPPSKRGGTMLSMIPQPVVSPIKVAAPLKPKATPILIRQLPRKSVPTATPPSGKANANDAINAPTRFSSTHHSHPSSQMTAVSLPGASSVSSPCEPYKQEPVSSPTSSFPSIMSFQTLTNWWSPGSTTATGTARVKQSTPNDVRKRKGTLERKYVSKERQLEKLRSRLEQERRANCRGHLHIDVCRACATGEVSL